LIEACDYDVAGLYYRRGGSSLWRIVVRIYVRLQILPEGILPRYSIT
jgi:hypothetical protein